MDNTAVFPPQGSSEFQHAPVLLEQVITFLRPQPGRVLVDATVGGGGHAERMLLESHPDGRVIGLDQDPAALTAATIRLQPFQHRFIPLHGRFSELTSLLVNAGVTSVDGVLADLGVSSHQLDTPARGFSFRADGPLDMRMNPLQDVSAADLVNGSPEEDLARIFWAYGEERFARRIAATIVRTRQQSPIRRTLDLARLIAEVVPTTRDSNRIHPATRTFQALRIAVNDELQELATGLEAACGALRPGGRMVILSFHSLEDRIVKQFFRDKAAVCVCPPSFPVCRCQKRAELRVLTRKPLGASEEEVAMNARARSARLRVAERLNAAEEELEPTPAS